MSRPFRRDLSAYWKDHLKLVEDVDVEGWVATSPDDDRLPDICVYLVGDDAERQVPHRIPALVFEFVSKSRSDQERDYIHKRDEYHAVGVKEYVIVDRFKRSVLVLTWQPDEYAERTLTEHESYSTSLLPGLALCSAWLAPLPALLSRHRFRFVAGCLPAVCDAVPVRLFQGRLDNFFPGVVEGFIEQTLEVGFDLRQVRHLGSLHGMRRGRTEQRTRPPQPSLSGR